MSEVLPPIDLIIPAYNEGLGIKGTLQSMLAQTFHEAFRLRVQVVANSCTDDTVKHAEDQIPQFMEHPNLSLEVYDTPLRGKQKSLNFGYEQSDAPHVIIGDADIRYGAGCLQTVTNNLVRPDVWISAPFSRPVLPERPSTLLEQVQLIKQLNREEDVKTAPTGALIGFKREAIESFPTNVASDDTWLSLKVASEHGWPSINVDTDAEVYFKPPTNWPEFLRQEARFLRGTRQLLETMPDLVPIMESGDARRLPTSELRQRVAKRWQDMGLTVSSLIYANEILPTQIEETYDALATDLVRADLTWAPAVTTKQF